MVADNPDIKIPPPKPEEPPELNREDKLVVFVIAAVFHAAKIAHDPARTSTDGSAQNSIDAARNFVRVTKEDGCYPDEVQS